MASAVAAASLPPPKRPMQTTLVFQPRSGGSGVGVGTLGAMAAGGGGGAPAAKRPRLVQAAPPPQHAPQRVLEVLSRTRIQTPAAAAAAAAVAAAASSARPPVPTSRYLVRPPVASSTAASPASSALVVRGGGAAPTVAPPGQLAVATSPPPSRSGGFLWADEYARRCTLDGVIGERKACGVAREALLTFLSGTCAALRDGKTALLLVGPSGCGKSLLIGAVARAQGREIWDGVGADIEEDVEKDGKKGGKKGGTPKSLLLAKALARAALRASEEGGRASSTKQRIALIDTLESLKDAERKGVAEFLMSRGASEARALCPIILTCDSLYGDTDMRDITRCRRVAVVHMELPQHDVLSRILRETAAMFGWPNLSATSTHSVARRAGYASVRAAINLLQTLLTVQYRYVTVPASPTETDLPPADPFGPSETTGAVLLRVPLRGAPARCILRELVGDATTSTGAVLLRVPLRGGARCILREPVGDATTSTGGGSGDSVGGARRGDIVWAWDDPEHADDGGDGDDDDDNEEEDMTAAAARAAARANARLAALVARRRFPIRMRFLFKPEEDPARKKLTEGAQRALRDAEEGDVAPDASWTARDTVIAAATGGLEPHHFGGAAVDDLGVLAAWLAQVTPDCARDLPSAARAMDALSFSDVLMGGSDFSGQPAWMRDHSLLAEIDYHVLRGYSISLGRAVGGRSTLQSTMGGFPRALTLLKHETRAARQRDLRVAASATIWMTPPPTLHVPAVFVSSTMQSAWAAAAAAARAAAAAAAAAKKGSGANGGGRARAPRRRALTDVFDSDTAPVPRAAMLDSVLPSRAAAEERLRVLALLLERASAPQYKGGKFLVNAAQRARIQLLAPDADVTSGVQELLNCGTMFSPLPPLPPLPPPPPPPKLSATVALARLAVALDVLDASDEGARDDAVFTCLRALQGAPLLHALLGVQTAWPLDDDSCGLTYGEATDAVLREADIAVSSLALALKPKPPPAAIGAAASAATGGAPPLRLALPAAPPRPPPPPLRRVVLAEAPPPCHSDDSAHKHT